jgi:chromosome segregation ATPase
MLDAKAQRDGTTIVAQQAQRQIRRSVSDMGIRLRRVQQTAARSVVENTDSLKALIATLSAQTDTLIVAQAELVAQLDTAEAALTAERKATSTALREADATILAYREALDASQKALNAPQTACTVLGVPCPTRTQAMAAGVILGVLAGVLR